ncbi:hypothetical protein A2954_01445 [Candidatus Roizmanbacteria bacterium RIFCSPLOWO2_01_FULL_37_12]|uniref:Glycosyltransferase RgtA/B/C/D-like domain-containing protein n=1 Tax=Candidatus Roizmanbacteria bacterium RIFCSPLOWO2_01_FULL_37_12 TaxID=1802056 RepID=A0A1F7IGJ6_9BACT|nr:MAG: hypothetical protein A3D76_00480 [Candidatus Roizmanbacteria bacterium RIFCSPHIGHO2_02_FULL_37_9b]OGK42488.1 MAG: hypothetical protein A2954_01445 [Candidatus Roizmanbacteria bacterium RIFCSPLOWO2_01_FULL_37_12]
MKKNIWLHLSLLLSFLFLLTSYIPNFYEASIANLLPSDRVMTPAEHMYTYDYNVYLSKIRQGTEGRWRVVDKYDNSTNQKGVFLQMLYLLAGKIGVLGLSPGLIFHLLRSIASAVWVLTIIYLNFYFLKKPFWAFIGVLLSLFAASWPVFYQYLGTTWIGIHMAWWQELDVLKRISYIPHYTLNYIIIAVLTILLYKSQETTNPTSLFELRRAGKKQTTYNIQNSKLKNIFILITNNYYLITCIVLFFSFFIHPSSGLLFLISWALYHLIKLIWDPKTNIKNLITNIYFTVILFLVAAIPLIYFQYVTSDYPWKSLVDFDKFNRYPVNVKEYILALGPVLITGVLGALVVIIKKEQKYLSLVSWILGAFLAIFAFKKFPLQSELRFVQTANHIPLAILSVYFLEKLIRWKQQIPFLLLKKIINLIIFVIVAGIVSLGIAQSYFSIKSQTDFIHQRVVAGQPLVPYPPQVMYPLKDMYNAFIWLDKNSKNEEVVLSHIYAGNYIPAYSGNYVYLGHNPETPHYNERVKKLEAFYSGILSNQEAKKFLKDEKISHIVYGPQEKQKSVKDVKKYSFLKEVYNSGFVRLFKFSNQR